MLDFPNNSKVFIVWGIFYARYDRAITSYLRFPPKVLPTMAAEGVPI